MKAEDITDEQYFAWIETPGIKPGEGCKYATVGDAWEKCRADFGIEGDWREGMPYFFNMITRWLLANR